MSIHRIEILGVPVDCVNWSSALGEVRRILRESNGPATVIAVNPEKVMQARENPELLRRLRAASMLIPDGIGVVWAAKFLGLGRMERVPGSEMMPAICEIAAAGGHGVFLFGANSEVNAKAANKLIGRYPLLRIVGQQDGYVSDAETPALIERINESQAEILFVALGSPKQEIWMEQNLHRLNIKLCQGVGGTFDVIAGTVKRAPRLFLALNLEWLYRVITNPRRIKRQLALPNFAWKVICAKLMK